MIEFQYLIENGAWSFAGFLLGSVVGYCFRPFIDQAREETDVQDDDS